MRSILFSQAERLWYEALAENWKTQNILKVYISHFNNFIKLKSKIKSASRCIPHTAE